MQDIVALLKSIGTARLAAMGAVAAGLVGFFVFVIMQMTTPHMAALYTDLSFDDSAAILRELDSRNIPYKVNADGSTILAPKDAVLRLRMDLARDGLPSGGGVGYEIFDKSDALGTTSFVQNVNHLRALEGELARSVRTIDRVVAARVHLVIPERQLFQRERREPSASIMLKVRGELDAAQIRAIQHLIAAAVEGLRPGRVSLVDETGRLLADGTGESDTLSALVLDERRLGIENALRDAVSRTVESIVGAGRARVNVAADLHRNRVTETTDRYDPDGRVVRSVQSREEESASSRRAENGSVSVGNQIPGGGDQGAAGEGRDSDRVAKSEEVTNYEISRTTRTQVTEPGSIRRISVAVVVDGVYVKEADGALVYRPRQQEELDRIAALVRTAIGFDEARGDHVEIANLRFAEPPLALPPGLDSEPLLDFTRQDYLYFAQLAVLLLLGLLVIFFVVRPLVRRIVTPDESLPALPVPAPADRAAEENLPVAARPQIPPADMPMIEQARIAGEIAQSSVRQVGEIVDTHPNEAVAIVRQWMQEKAA